LKTPENILLRKLFGLKEREVTGQWSKLQTLELKIFTVHLTSRAQLNEI
jgi:hypothetical protein